MWREGNPCHCWWQCKLVQPLWKITWMFLKKLKVELPFVVQAVSHVRLLFATTGTPARQASLSCAVSQSLLKLMLIESVMPSNHLILCCPFLLLPLIFPSTIRVFSNKLVLHIMWPKYWSFSFSISPSRKHSGLISFRIDWFDFFAVQGALKSLNHHHNSKASVLQCSAFLMVQLSLPYMTTGNLCWQSGVSLFNTLPRFVLAFFPRSEGLLLPLLQSPSAMILEPKKIKSVTVSTLSPSICHEVVGPDAMILVF